MDVLLPVFQLLYFVTHFLYSLAQSVASTWNLLLAFALRSGGSARSSGSDGHGKGLAKTPRHLGLVLGLPSPGVHALAALVGEAAGYGVEYVSVYDIVGDVKLRKGSVLRHLENVSGLKYRFVEHCGGVEGRREGCGEMEERREGCGETEERREGCGEMEERREALGEVEGRREGCGETEERREALGEMEERRKGSGEMEERRKGLGETEGDEEEENFKKNLENSGKKLENLNVGASPPPSCPDTRPLVTIKFLGVEAGRHVLAAATLSHARTLQVASAAERASFTRPGLRRRRKECFEMFPESFPKSAENFPKSSEKFPKSAGKILGNPENFPKSAENIPKSPEIFPKSAENIPKSPENIPKSAENIPRSAENFPENPQNTPKNSLAPQIIPLHPQKPSLGLQTPSAGLPTSRDISEAVSLGLPDPEVVVTLGLNSSLGYPPWKLRAAEIHFLDLSECSGGLGKVLEAYAGCEQRWGR